MDFIPPHYQPFTKFGLRGFTVNSAKNLGEPLKTSEFYYKAGLKVENVLKTV
jgi:hypothetical protein